MVPMTERYTPQVGDFVRSSLWISPATGYYEVIESGLQEFSWRVGPVPAVKIRFDNADIWVDLNPEEGQEWILMPGSAEVGERIARLNRELLEAYRELAAAQAREMVK